MIHRYSHTYAPIVRRPGLFNHYARASPGHPANYALIPVQTSYYPSLYASQNQAQYPQYLRTSTPYIPQPYLSHPSYSSYPSYLATSPSSPQFQFLVPSYATPAVPYAPTVSSRGLVLVLIATLILVALDLAIVRPQKLRAQIRGSAVVHDLVNN